MGENAPFSVLSGNILYKMKPGHKYYINIPNFETTNNQVKAGQTGTTVLLTLRETHNQVAHACSYGEDLKIDGNVYSSIQLYNASVDEVLYIYDGIQTFRKQEPIGSYTGDYFNDVVAASTAVTDRTSYTGPGASAEVPVFLAYNLSIGSKTGTAGDDYYIALINNNNNYRNIYCLSGTIHGVVRAIGEQEINIEYYNNDSVAHRMAASFYWLVGAWE